MPVSFADRPHPPVCIRKQTTVMMYACCMHELSLECIASKIDSYCACGILILLEAPCILFKGYIRCCKHNGHSNGCHGLVVAAAAVNYSAHRSVET